MSTLLYGIRIQPPKLPDDRIHDLELPYPEHNTYTTFHCAPFHPGPGFFHPELGYSDIRRHVASQSAIGITEPENAIMAHSFQQLMGKVLGDVFIAAITSVLSVIVGFIIVVFPRWLRKSSNLPFYYGAIQLILSLFILVTGAYLANHVYGFQFSFEGLRRNDRIPYYSITYYCGVGEAIYGALMILIGVGSFFMFLKFEN